MTPAGWFLHSRTRSACPDARPARAGTAFLKEEQLHNNKNNLEVGRFLVSPMSQPRPGGGFDALVSIRSGSGQASVDRVMRFTPQFSSPQAALHYAQAEGLAWASCH